MPGCWTSPGTTATSTFAASACEYVRVVPTTTCLPDQVRTSRSQQDKRRTRGLICAFLRFNRYPLLRGGWGYFCVANVTLHVSFNVSRNVIVGVKPTTRCCCIVKHAELAFNALLFFVLLLVAVFLFVFLPAWLVRAWFRSDTMRRYLECLQIPACAIEAQVNTKCVVLYYYYYFDCPLTIADKSNLTFTQHALHIYSYLT